MKHSITAICTSLAVSSILFSSVTAAETTVLLADSVYSLSVASDPQSARLYNGSPVIVYTYDTGGKPLRREWISSGEYHFDWIKYNSDGDLTWFRGYDCDTAEYSMYSDPYAEQIWNAAQGRSTSFDELGRVLTDTTFYSGGFGWGAVECREYIYGVDSAQMTFSHKWWDKTNPYFIVMYKLKDGFPVSATEYRYGTGTVEETFKFENTVINDKVRNTRKETFFGDGKPRFLETNTYDAQGRLIEEYQYTYSFATLKGTTPESAMLTVHHYGVPSGVAISSGNRVQKAAVMPVKLQGKTLVSLASRPVLAEIFTVNGKKIAFGALPLEFPSSGIFSVKIASIEGNLISRMVVR